ncbi:hypothetical protein HYFRA_00001872 [Hymenoscyphus fraxineus]|uniref:Uncharacterized protein n=1 Tax=Hymenoscyphus fraxineus TaxID=746836 RepID=A0A9N9KKV4_9HELO|nr:hypothetical protein HYFRA_00001872 [Hymenoscyphus fraxineus]
MELQGPRERHFLRNSPEETNCANFCCTTRISAQIQVDSLLGSYDSICRQADKSLTKFSDALKPDDDQPLVFETTPDPWLHGKVSTWLFLLLWIVSRFKFTKNSNVCFPHRVAGSFSWLSSEIKAEFNLIDRIGFSSRNIKPTCGPLSGKYAQQWQLYPKSVTPYYRNVATKEDQEKSGLELDHVRQEHGNAGEQFPNETHKDGYSSSHALLKASMRKYGTRILAQTVVLKLQSPVLFQWVPAKNKRRGPYNLEKWSGGTEYGDDLGVEENIEENLPTCDHVNMSGHRCLSVLAWHWLRISKISGSSNETISSISTCRYKQHNFVLESTKCVSAVRDLTTTFGKVYTECLPETIWADSMRVQGRTEKDQAYATTVLEYPAQETGYPTQNHGTAPHILANMPSPRHGWLTQEPPEVDQLYPRDFQRGCHMAHIQEQSTKRLKEPSVGSHTIEDLVRHNFLVARLAVHAHAHASHNEPISTSTPPVLGRVHHPFGTNFTALRVPASQHNRSPAKITRVHRYTDTTITIERLPTTLPALRLISPISAELPTSALIWQLAKLLKIHDLGLGSRLLDR